jgi:protein-disulfide isomerase
MITRKDIMYRTLARAIALALLLCSVAGAQDKPAAVEHKAKAAPASSAGEGDSAAKPLSEETVNAFMQQTFGYDPTLSWKVLEIKPSEAQGLTEVSVLITGPQGAQNAKFYVTADGKHAMAGDLMPFGAKPFAPAAGALKKGINGPSKGPQDSPVLIVEFSDLQCPHCKDAQPIIEKLLTDEPQARFVFQSFPLPSHNWAAKAAAYADCVARASNDAFWKFVAKTYEAQAQITEANADEKLTGIAADSGVNGADAATCAAKPETAERVNKSLALGKTVGVNSTPTVFVNGRRIGNLGIPPETLKQLVDFAAK